MKRIHLCRWWRAALLAAVLTPAPGCQTISQWFFGEPGPPRLLHLHTFTWEPTEGNRLSYLEYAGRTMYLDPAPVLSAADIGRIVAFDVPGGRGLKLHLTEHGKNRWLHVTAARRGEQLVVMLDDSYRGGYRLTGPDDTGVVSLAGPFTPQEARDIVAKAEENHNR